MTPRPAAAKPAATQPVIHVVDDDDGVRASLRWLVESVGYEVRTYRNGREFLDTYNEQLPGCMLLDVRMPVMGGFELLDMVGNAGDLLPILFLTGHGTIPMSVKAMKQGAFDFIEKPFNDQDLIDRIQLATNRSLKAHQQKALGHRQTALLAQLSPREWDVVNELVKGKASKRIAADLGISKKTVEVHRANIREKLGVTSVAELVRLVLNPERAP